MSIEYSSPSFVTDPRPDAWYPARRIDATDPRFPDETRARVWVDSDSGIEFAFGHDDQGRFMYASEIVSSYSGTFKFDDALRLLGTEDHIDPSAPLLIEGRPFRMNTALPILGRQSFRNLGMFSNLPLNQFIQRETHPTL